MQVITGCNRYRQVSSGVTAGRRRSQQAAGHTADTADRKTHQVAGHSRSQDTVGRRTQQVAGHSRSQDTADRRTQQVARHSRS